MGLKENYELSLSEPEWIKFSREIKVRDDHTCTACNSKTPPLHAHHKYYVRGRNAWEYPQTALVTLCNHCHQKAHESRIKVYWEGELKLLKIENPNLYIWRVLIFLAEYGILTSFVGLTTVVVIWRIVGKPLNALGDGSILALYIIGVPAWLVIKYLYKKLNESTGKFIFKVIEFGILAPVIGFITLVILKGLPEKLAYEVIWAYYLVGIPTWLGVKYLFKKLKSFF